MTFGKLNSYGLISISGEDAATFLQGQLTNDLNLLTENAQWQYSAYCNPKGRVLALLQIWKVSDQEFYAVLSKDLLESTINRLRMYVMRSKVIIEALERTLIGFNSLQSLSEFNHENIAQIILNNTKTVCRINNDQYILKIADRYILINAPTENLPSFDLVWLSHNIADGLPHITADTTESFIPQMINLDLLDGINFKKGCYTGQEIVARMHYLGNLKQRMFVCEIQNDDSNIKIGDKIFVDSENSTTVGSVSNTAADSDKILAVLKLAFLDNELYLENGHQIQLTEPQPYAIPTE